MKTTTDLFEAFLKCPTKLWLRAGGEPSSGNTYAEWVKTQGESYRALESERTLAETSPNVSARSPSLEDLKTARWRFGVDVDVVAQASALPRSSRSQEVVSPAAQPSAINSQPTSQSLVTLAATDQGGASEPGFGVETRLHAVERVPSEGRGKAAQFIPIRFIFRNKLTKDDRLLLAFDAFVLSAALGRAIATGKITHGEGCGCARDSAAIFDEPAAGKQTGRTTAALSRAQPRVTKVKTSALAGEVRKRLDKIAALLSSPAPPDLVLNRHCAECEFQARCRKIAVEKDDLSLLAGMSAKERQKLRSKGIFTVTQLSYTFRPRRRPKRLRDKREKYHHSLKALAIREKKIHIVGSPELKIEGTPVYLDVEGLPDRDFYYLIGLRIGNGDSAVQHSLWADTVEDEGKIWREFLAILETVEKPVLIFYGSYEITFLRQMREQYSKTTRHDEPPETTETTKCNVNLLSTIFAQLYFPTFSNGLKEIGWHLNCAWSDSNPSGCNTIAWRSRWEATGDQTLRQYLIQYNTEDCLALEQVTHCLQVLSKGGSSNPESVVLVPQQA